MRSCVLTYVLPFFCIFIWSDVWSCTITWNNYIFAWVGECINFVLYVLAQHLCWIKIRTLTWIFQKVTFYAWILFAWMDFLFGFPAKPSLRDSVIGWNMFVFLFPNSCSSQPFSSTTLEKSPEPLMLAKDLNWLVAIVVTLNKSAWSMFEGVDTKLLTTAWMNIGLD